MNENRDMPLGNINDLAVDDVPHRAEKQHGDEPETDRPSRKNLKNNITLNAGHGQGLWIGITGFLAIALMLLSAWFYNQLQIVTARADQALAASRQEVQQLSSLLSATDETLNQSSGQIQETLNLHMSEIRKLWDIANRRNRVWIEESQQAIKALEQRRDETTVTLAAIRNESVAVKQQVTTFNAQVEKFNREIAALQQELTVAQHNVRSSDVLRNQLQTQVDLVNETLRQIDTRSKEQQVSAQRVSTLMPRLESLATAEAQQPGLGARIKELEAATAAFDEYRRQLNVKLEQLQSTPR